jgi:hypothetical protein
MNLLELIAGPMKEPRKPEGLEPCPTRRALLSPGAVIAALWAASEGRACAPAVTDATMRLVHRITMGMTEADMAEVLAQGGFNGYVEDQLDHLNIPDTELDTRLANYATLTMEPYQLIPLTANQVISELVEATILRSVLSKRQLFERVVEFWTDHFNIDINNGTDSWLKTIDDRDVIRANALGTFPALLSASAHSPAMLYYLDNNVSTANNINENYGRELLELHSLGVDGGYTQQDVVEVSRCFTGWTLWGTNQGTNSWKFRYNANAHDNGSKVVLGQTIPAGGGITDGETVLNILANHPSTRQFISKKMCKWFYGYDPPQSLVDAVAATYLATGGNIKEMLRTLFYSAEFAGATPKYKRPYHLFVSAMRASATNITATTTFRSQHLAAAGHAPYAWGPPDGYPDTLEFWVGLILPRWNFGASLMNSNISGLSVDINVFLTGVPNTAQAVIDRIDAALFGGTMNPTEKTLIRDYMLPDPPTTLKKREGLGLAMGSPGYQWY